MRRATVAGNVPVSVDGRCSVARSRLAREAAPAANATLVERIA
jgi:hypothetical protein